MTDPVRAKPEDSVLVRVRGLTTVLNGKKVFDALDLDIPRGKITAIMGPSGTGKTTLLKHITGQMRADAGEILVDGQNVPGCRATSCSNCASASVTCSRIRRC